MVRVTVLNYREKGEAEEQMTRKVLRTTTTSARPTSGRPTERITPQILLQTITHSRRTHARAHVTAEMCGRGPDSKECLLTVIGLCNVSGGAEWLHNTVREQGTSWLDQRYVLCGARRKLYDQECEDIDNNTFFDDKCKTWSDLERPHI